MSDVFSQTKRSLVMSRIRSRGNKETELKLVSIFKNSGITGWRRHQKLPGNPDFIFRAEKLAVFVDGCFWHACPRCYRAPTSNQEYWMEKKNRNRRRDKLVERQLKKSGWKVMRIWEHDLRTPDRVVTRIRTARSR